MRTCVRFPEQEFEGGVPLSDSHKENNMDNRDGDKPANAEDAADRVREVAGDATQRVKDAAGSAVTDIKHAALDQVEMARGKAGDMGHSTATKFREIAGQVEQDLPWLSGAFTKSAEGLDSVTDSLTRGDLSQTLNGLTDFAKRQPALFLGASVALGFALARIGKTALEDAAPSPRVDEPAPKPFDGASTAYPTPTGV
jgi:hypothetical protein